MRTVITALVLASAICLMGGCACTVDPLVGSWERLDDAGRPTGQIKILNETHFAFASPGDENTNAAGGGTWHQCDGTYFETILYHFHPRLVGRTIEFRCQLVEDLWLHTGEFRAGNRIFDIDETWRRISPRGKKNADKED